MNQILLKIRIQKANQMKSKFTCKGKGNYPEGDIEYRDGNYERKHKRREGPL